MIYACICNDNWNNIEQLDYIGWEQGKWENLAVTPFVASRDQATVVLSDLFELVPLSPFPATHILYQSLLPSRQKYLLIDNIIIAHTITVYYEQPVTDAHGYLIANIIEYLSIEKISDHQFRSDLYSLDHGPLGILSVSHWLNPTSRLVCHG